LMQCTPDGTCLVDYDVLSVRQLKQLLSQHKIDHSLCVEKSDLVQLAQANNLSTAQETVINIDIVSDTMCPWCFVGKRFMEKAITQLQGTTAVKFKITWLPFFLNPHIPDTGLTIAEYMAKVYGNTNKLATVHQYLTTAGKQVGINFKLSEDRKVYPTLHSHRFVEWASKFGKQDEAMELLFREHFEEGKALNDFHMLISVAQKIGLDPLAAQAYLNSSENVAEIKQQDAKFKQGHRGVNGVPHFIIYKNGDNSHPQSLSGAQQPEAFLQVFKQLW